MKTIIKLLLIYIGFQVLGAVVASPVMFFLDKMYMLALTLVLSSLMMIWYLFKKQYLRLDQYTWSIRSVRVLLWAIAWGLGAYLMCGGLDELLDLPNLMEEQFEDLSFNVVGVLAIVVVGPIAEELLFRGAILGFLLKKRDLSYKYAILISALLFGLIHMNPAQIVYAFVLGMVLGRIYYQSGSLLLCIILHVLLNGLSTAITICNPDAQSLGEFVGTTATGWFLLGGAVIMIACGRLFNNLLKAPFWKEPVFVEEMDEAGVNTKESKE